MILTDRKPPAWRPPRPKPSPLPLALRVPIVVDPWAEEHGILLIGTQQDSNELYYDGFDASLTVDPTTVEGYNLAMEGLKKLPNYVIVAMEPQYNSHTEVMEHKAVYFSTAFGRGYAMIMPRNYTDVLRDVYAGFILEYGISQWENLALHECGHIIDYLGITGEYYWNTIWPELKSSRINIFDAMGDLISGYAKTNIREDFAEHFCYYVWKGTTFREKMVGNPDLEKRYNFLRDYLFLGVEYEEPIPPPITILEGEVRDGQGKAVPDALVYSRGTWDGFLVRTNIMGKFTLQGIPSGNYTIWAEKEGYRKSEEASFNLVAGEPVEVILEVTQAPPNLVWIIPVGLVGIALYLAIKK